MFDLFVKQKPIEAGALKPSQWSFISRGYKKNIDKVMGYYQFYPNYVRSDHFLIRLIQSLAIPVGLPLERYYARVDANALNLSMALRMTSSIYKGYLHTGIFYGKGNPEILLANDDYFDINYVHNNWKNANAVRPIWHSKSDLKILLPDGKSYNDNNDLAIVSINIPMLAVQYRAFVLSQTGREYSKTIAQFIGSYVLPNMLPTHCEICFFNRIVNKHYEIPQSNDKQFKRHAFSLSDYERHIDSAIVTVLKNIDAANGRFDVTLKQIPSFINDDIYSSLMMPDYAPTSQIQWALMLSRLPVIDFLMDVAKDRNKSINTVYINQLKRDFSLNNAVNIMHQMLPFDESAKVKEYVDNIKYVINK